MNLDKNDCIYKETNSVALFLFLFFFFQMHSLLGGALSLPTNTFVLFSTMVFFLFNVLKCEVKCIISISFCVRAQYCWFLLIELKIQNPS